VDIEEESAFYRALREFKPSSTVHCHSSRPLTYTDGVKFLADTLNAHWLIDAIASFQPAALQDSGLAEFQLWELIVRDGSARLICSRDSDEKVFQHRFPRTDCPIDYVRLYLRGGVLMLPSER
jgi:hypothetical protein